MLLAVVGGSATTGLSATDARAEPLPVIKVNVWAFLYVPGTKPDVMAPATRQSSRFSQVYEQYKKAPDVTRQRIYLETMERVLGSTDKTIIDTGTQPSPGVVPYLPLQTLPRERSGQQQQPTGGSQ